MKASVALDESRNVHLMPLNRFEVQFPLMEEVEEKVCNLENEGLERIYILRLTLSLKGFPLSLVQLESRRGLRGHNPQRRASEPLGRNFYPLRMLGQPQAWRFRILGFWWQLVPRR